MVSGVFPIFHHSYILTMHIAQSSVKDTMPCVFKSVENEPKPLSNNA